MSKEEWERPKRLDGFTVKVKTGLGELFITINEDEQGNLREVFAIVGKSGASTQAKAEAIGRLVSLNLQHDVKVEKIIHQLIGISGEHPLASGKGGEDMMLSIPDAIAKTLEHYYGEKKEKLGKPKAPEDRILREDEVPSE